MSKVTIEYDTTDPEQSQELKRVMKAEDMASFIWELQHNFWRKWKHDDTNFNLDTYREELSLLLNQYNINIDELTD